MQKNPDGRVHLTHIVGAFKLVRVYVKMLTASNFKGRKLPNWRDAGAFGVVSFI